MQTPTAELPRRRSSLVIGLEAGLFSMLVVLLGAFPARLLLAMRDGEPSWLWLQRVVLGTLLDASAVMPAGAVVVVGVVVPSLMLRSLRRPGWHMCGPMTIAVPWAFAVMALSMIAQQVYAERGAYPTAFDIVESANGSFVKGVFGFLSYRHIWVPTLLTVLAAVAFFVVAARRAAAVSSSPVFVSGLVVGVVVTMAPTLASSRAIPPDASPLSREGLGEPLAGLINSGLDLVRYGKDATPRQFVIDLDERADDDDTHERGTRQLGWPEHPTSAGPHPYARPLDIEREHTDPTARGARLLASWQALSTSLFRDSATSQDAPAPAPIVIHVMLEGFRADDLHAQNPAAPPELAPFFARLYERAAHPEGPGDVVLAARAMHQAGVRTAQGLGAMTCGLGTLPWNLSFIRDLQPIELRCTLDVLHDAGATSSVWYGSDLSFDNMRRLFEHKRVTQIVSQQELPAGLPRGSWDAVTDRALVDQFVDGLAARAATHPTTPHHALLLTLSNHSPFTLPEDLDDDVKARVVGLYPRAPRAEEEDKRRLLTFAAVDRAMERLVARLTETGLADRTVVMLMADHSTGHRYVWGDGEETDDAYGRIPFVVVIPAALRARAHNDAAVVAAWREAQAQLDEGPLSLNDVPSLTLALLSATSMLQGLPPAQRWHTLGGQVTSPHFRAFADGAVIEGINGVSQVVALDARGGRIGPATRASFLQSSADRYRLTPALFPMASPLRRLLRASSTSSSTVASLRP